MGIYEMKRLCSSKGSSASGIAIRHLFCYLCVRSLEELQNAARLKPSQILSNIIKHFNYLQPTLAWIHLSEQDSLL